MLKTLDQKCFRLIVLPCHGVSFNQSRWIDRSRIVEIVERDDREMWVGESVKLQIFETKTATQYDMYR